MGKQHLENCSLYVQLPQVVPVKLDLGVQILILNPSLLRPETLKSYASVAMPIFFKKKFLSMGRSMMAHTFNPQEAEAGRSLEFLLVYRASSRTIKAT